MNPSSDPTLPGPSSVSIKKLSKQSFDELSFLTTPIKDSRKLAIPSSLRTNASSSTPLHSEKPDSHLNGPSPTPFSPASNINSLSRSKLGSNDSPSSQFKALSSSQLRSTFLNRLEPFKIIETLNRHLPLPSSPSSQPHLVPLKFDFNSFIPPEKFEYRYMFEKLSDRSDVLDHHLDQAALILADWYEIEHWSDPTLASQDDVWTVGRICTETQDSKLSDQACWLETSRMIGHGRRIRLQWHPQLKVHGVGSHEDGIGLFPGAILGLSGRNAGGTYFSVHEILAMPMAEPAMSSPQQLINYSSTDHFPLSLIVASGPFTWDQDLDFLPLRSLLNQLIKDKPDCLILLGPFIDINHPLIKSGDLDQFPTSIFQEKILAPLINFLDSSPHSKVILIPSPRDLLITHSVYPQARFDTKNPDLGLSKTPIVCLPNPTIFSINEIVIGINNVDVLMPLRKEEFFKAASIVSDDEPNASPDPNAKDIISRACRHVLRQRSFYPIFPSTLASGIDPVNLDVSHLDLLKHHSVCPDILIMPTNFTAFAKAIDSTVIVNPRHLCKGKGVGTYARFTIHPYDPQSLQNAMMETNDQDEKIEHFLFKRCRVDIVKI
ncbi:hypothetical protein O181_058817 [Austropuccinia psidii MF-1]|uniref:DNA polymerase alpha subunit B n=1 Tax=Austropuccinia psidii MF-1 TaxID=1389203 RepID=A0A9Q3HWU4_9BASI|nr:hypothetical protein [Austropuccinia psidii MF-1]